jgi:hypothetical protein
LEAALVEKESHINQMKENATASTPDQTTSIKELQQKEARTKLMAMKTQKMQQGGVLGSRKAVLQ